MDLLIVRHGPAGARMRWARTGEPDAARPLTRRGRKKMRRNARGLRAALPSLSLLASSPLARAAETADILARTYRRPVQTTPALEPSATPEQTTAWLRARARSRNARIAVVGHEPHLSNLAGWLLARKKKSLIELRKGGACLIHFDGPVEAGRGRLMWCLKPGQLRRLPD